MAAMCESKNRLLALKRRVAGTILPFSMCLGATVAHAMDTDIFTAQNNQGAAPNVLIVLDNTSNWARSDQKWPGSIVQGQAEVDAINMVVQSLPGSINVGLLEFVTSGNANDNGGYVRFSVSPVGQSQGTVAATNRTNFSNTLTTIYNNVTSPNEKQNSGTAYGNLMYDAYNYFGGNTPFAASADVVASLADSRGYVQNYTLFKSPLSAQTNCANNYIIFIGNPNSSGPTSDSSANSSTLLALINAARRAQGQSPLSALPEQSMPGYTQTNGNPTTVQSTGTFVTDVSNWNADEWSNFLHMYGVPVGTDGSRQTVSTYTIDVYNAKPDAGQSELLSSMARAGGGKYFAATNEDQIKAALSSIFAEIQAVNSVFASASLPISATNRAQSDNQVYIGMFRPDPTAHPRWFGNLKRYQLGVINGATNLEDFNAVLAISATTGFITPCAASWWTADSASYWYDSVNSQSRIFITQALNPGLSWQSAGDDTNYAKGGCLNTTTGGIWSDLPDGPIVEKGGAAEMLRQQSSRNIKTLNNGGSLTNFTTGTVNGLSANSAINNNIVNFIRGQDVTGEIAGVPSTNARPSIHGDVVHSRPLPIDYGGSTGVVIYYGAGDGVYRAVNANSGQELWSFVAPETNSRLQRLLDNSPLIQTPYPTPTGGVQVPGTTPKDFFFDGSTGLYQNATNSQVWIYPAMRRGGRMLYSFDVTTPGTPQLKWRIGCPNLTDDIGCTSGMSAIGQTWSTPSVAMLSGYSASAPVVIVGGGYDGCEDADSTTPSCATPKGAVVYVLDGDSGAVIRSFPTTRSVAADVSLVDINQDGTVDAAYVADTGGNIYRINFSDPTNSFAALSPSAWTITQVAYTTGAGRKFLFAPALLPYKNSVYVAIVSGDREHPLSANYPYQTPVVNRAYVYLDSPLRTGATNLDGPNMSNYTDTTSTGCNTNNILPGSLSYGWYMDLTANGPGEQGVTSALIIAGMVTFSTNRPVTNPAACTTALGEARGYWVNLLNASGSIGVSGVCGGRTSTVFLGGGLPPSPVSGTVSINGTPQVVVIGAVQKDPNGTNSALSGQQVRPPIASTRKKTYWRTTGDTH